MILISRSRTEPKIRYNMIEMDDTKPSKNELLAELGRLNRSGAINDEEFLMLRQMIRSGPGRAEFRRRFEALLGMSADAESKDPTAGEKG